MKTYTVPYGDDSLTFSLPPGMRGTLVDSAPLRPKYPDPKQGELAKAGDGARPELGEAKSQLAKL